MYGCYCLLSFENMSNLCAIYYLYHSARGRFIETDVFLFSAVRVKLNFKFNGMYHSNNFVSKLPVVRLYAI